MKKMGYGLNSLEVANYFSKPVYYYGGLVGIEWSHTDECFNINWFGDVFNLRDWHISSLTATSIMDSLNTMMPVTLGEVRYNNWVRVGFEGEGEVQSLFAPRRVAKHFGFAEAIDVAQDTFVVPKVDDYRVVSQASYTKIVSRDFPAISATLQGTQFLEELTNQKIDPTNLTIIRPKLTQDHILIIPTTTLKQLNTPTLTPNYTQTSYTHIQEQTQ